MLNGDAQRLGGEGVAYQYLPEDRPPRHRIEHDRGGCGECAGARRGPGEGGGCRERRVHLQDEVRIIRCTRSLQLRRTPAGATLRIPSAVSVCYMLASTISHGQTPVASMYVVPPMIAVPKVPRP